ncbi:MAG: hypothetical protein RML32_12025 [Gammaproteobacteria bacterium]|nr:hypothetical protein [Gammaproteobacteria bacterium]
MNFPIAGEWVALQTPAERIPSHGTDFFRPTLCVRFRAHEPRAHRVYCGFRIRGAHGDELFVPPPLQPFHARPGP